MEILGEYYTSIKKALSEVDENWGRYIGVIIAGSHNPNNFDIEYILDHIREAREKGFPLYGECWGYQMCAVEYARNVLGVKDATSEEWGKGTFVVKKRKNGLNVGHRNGESYWNNFEVDLLSWQIPSNFFIAQYHPSYESSLRKPHKLITEFLKYAREYTRNMAV